MQIVRAQYFEPATGRHGGSVAGVSNQKVESSSADWCTHIVFLGKTLISHSASGLLAKYYWVIIFG